MKSFLEVLQKSLFLPAAEREGALSFAASVADLPDEGCTVVVDMGGRSTEIAVSGGGSLFFLMSLSMSISVAHSRKLTRILSFFLGLIGLLLAAGAAGSKTPATVVSLPLGCLGSSLPEKPSNSVNCSSSGSLSASAKGEGPQELAVSGEQRMALLCQRVRHVLQSNPELSGLRAKIGSPQTKLVLTGGTATTAAALVLGLPSYDGEQVHMSCLQRQQLLDLGAWLAGEREGEGAKNPNQRRLLLPMWVSSSRTASLPTGCAVLAELMCLLCQEKAVVSNKDMLDSIMLEMELQYWHNS